MTVTAMPATAQKGEAAAPEPEEKKKGGLKKILIILADGSKALDATITEFSGLSIAEVNDPKKRAALKKELQHHLGELYEDEVMGVYFTEFVTQ